MNEDHPIEEDNPSAGMPYGVDAYSRYHEYGGERYVVEAWPFERRRLIMRLRYRLGIISWHLGILRQHGFSTWRKLASL